MITSEQFIVLDKAPYRENALLLRGVTPDYGKTAFILHGGQSGSRPVADLFRELEIEFEYKDVPQELYTAKKAEILTDFSPIAENPQAYRMAGRIAAFILNNMPSGVAQPYTFDTLRSVLANLTLSGNENIWDLVQCAVVLKTTFLYENGMLPEGTSDEQNEFLENLVASGIDNSPLPECPAKYFDALNSWLNSLIEYHQLKR